MKFVSFLQSLFIPSCMVKRKGMNIFISLAILLLASALLALPMILYFSNQRYEVMDEYLNLEIFNYCVDEDDELGKFTEEEKDEYNLVYFKDIKELGITAGIDGIGYDVDKVVMGQEYVVKSYVPVTEDGEIKSYDTYYIHIVVDDVDVNENNELIYSIENKFCKYPREEDNTFHHVLVAFYTEGIIFSYSDVYSECLSLEYKNDTDIVFSEAEDMSYVSHSITDLLYKLYIYQATKKTFISAFLFPILIAFLFSFVIKGPLTPLKGIKEFIAICAVSCITPTIACAIASSVSLTWCSYAFNYYPFLAIGYYLVVLILINRRSRLNKDELRTLKEVK